MESMLGKRTSAPDDNSKGGKDKRKTTTTTTTQALSQLVAKSTEEDNKIKDAAMLFGPGRH